MAEQKERLIAIFHSIAVFFLLLNVLLRPLVCGLSGGLASNIIVAMPLLGAAFLWIMAMVMGQELRLHRTPMDFPILFLILFALASVLTAAYKHSAASVAFDWICYALLFYVVVNLCAEAPRLGLLLLLASLASTFVVSLNGLFQKFYSLKLTRDLFMANKETWVQSLGLPPDAVPDFIGRLGTGRIFSSFLLPNTCAGFLGVMIPVQVGLLVWGLATVRRDGRNASRWRAVFLAVNLAALLAGILCLFYTKSKGGWISLALVVLAFAVMSGRRWVARYWPWALGALAVVVLLLATLQLTHRIPPMDEYFESFSVRTDYWRAGALIIKDHPWSGVGLDNFGEYYPQYRRPEDDESLMAHNNYIQVWAETGFFGLLAFCAVWAAFFYAMRRRGEKPPVEGNQRHTAGAMTRGELRLLAGFAALIGFAMIFTMFSTFEPLPQFAPWLLTACFGLCWAAFYFANEAAFSDVIDLHKANPEAGTVIRLSITFGVLFFLVHSLADFDLYEQGIAQTLWLLMAIGLTWGSREHKVVRVPLGSVGQLMVAAPVILLMGILLCLLAPRFIEARVRLENGRDLVAHHDEQEAIKEWLAAERSDPWDSETQIALAERFYLQWSKGVKEYAGAPTVELALAHVQRAIELNPRRARYHHMLARLYDEMSLKETSADAAERLRKAALSEYELAHRFFPATAPYAADLAIAYDHAGRQAEALPLYEEALELDDQARPERFTTKLQPELRRKIEQRIAVPEKRR